MIRKTSKLGTLALCVALGLFKGDASAATLPTVSSATLTYRIDAKNLNNDGGVTNPGDGNTVATWRELTTNTPLNIQGTPSWFATGLAGGPTVRFDGGTGFDDLVFSNDPAILNTSARTIISVAKMVSNGTALSGLVTDSSDTNNIRQDISENPRYFSGNTADFHTGGTFAVNGSQTFNIPGGFGAAHVVKSVSPSTTNINSLRIGSNVGSFPNLRVWAGDVSELLVYNGVLNGNDTAQVNKYLIDQYGINTVVDEALTNTSQIADDPWGPGRNFHIGVDFNYGAAAAGPFKGINFDNVNLSGGTPPAGPFTLNANALTAGTTLTLNLPFTIDNTPRGITATATGTDAGSINALNNEMFYLSNSADHPSATMTFGNLAPLQEAYVQVFGSHNGWAGDITVAVNGGTPFTANWTTVTNGVANLASVYGFYGTTDASGNLTLKFTISSGDFAAIGGMIVTMVPEPSSLTLFGLASLGLLRFRRRSR